MHARAHGFRRMHRCGRIGHGNYWSTEMSWLRLRTCSEATISSSSGIRLLPHGRIFAGSERRAADAVNADAPYPPAPGR